MNILFVCTGNTCRSPMAEAILKEKMPEAKVQSVGIFANENEMANNHAIQVLEEKGIRLVHQSKAISLDHVYWADIILTMTEDHKKMILVLFSQYAEKIFTLIEYTSDHVIPPHHGGLNIPDPFGGSVEVYRDTADTLEVHLEDLVRKLKK